MGVEAAERAIWDEAGREDMEQEDERRNDLVGFYPSSMRVLHLLQEKRVRHHYRGCSRQ